MPLSTVLCPLLQQTTFQPAAAVLKHAVFHCGTTSIPKWEGSSLDLENPQKMQKSLTFECELTQADWHDLQPFHCRVGAVGCHMRVTPRIHILPTPEKGHAQKGKGFPLKSWLHQLPTRDVGHFYASSTRWILIGTSSKGWLWELYGLGS